MSALEESKTWWFQTHPTVWSNETGPYSPSYTRKEVVRMMCCKESNWNAEKVSHHREMTFCYLIWCWQCEKKTLATHWQWTSDRNRYYTILLLLLSDIYSKQKICPHLVLGRCSFLTLMPRSGWGCKSCSFGDEYASKKEKKKLKWTFLHWKHLETIGHSLINCSYRLWRQREEPTPLRPEGQKSFTPLSSPDRLCSRHSHLQLHLWSLLDCDTALQWVGKHKSNQLEFQVTASVVQKLKRKTKTR